MKNTFFIGSLICAFLVSCHVNENKKKDPELILGTWNLTNIESKLSGNSASFFIEQMLNKQIKEHIRSGGEITFFDDKTFKENIFFDEQGVYSISTDTFLLTVKQKELNFTLLTLDENTLKASIDLTNELTNLGINLSDYLSGEISVSAVVTFEKMASADL